MVSSERPRRTRRLFGWGAPWAPVVLALVFPWLAISIGSILSPPDQIDSILVPVAGGIVGMVLILGVFLRRFSVKVSNESVRHQGRELRWADVARISIEETGSRDVLPDVQCPVLYGAGGVRVPLDELAGFAWRGANARVSAQTRKLCRYAGVEYDPRIVVRSGAPRRSL